MTYCVAESPSEKLLSFLPQKVENNNKVQIIQIKDDDGVDDDLGWLFVDVGMDEFLDCADLSPSLNSKEKQRQQQQEYHIEASSSSTSSSSTTTFNPTTRFSNIGDLIQSFANKQVRNLQYEDSASDTMESIIKASTSLASDLSDVEAAKLKSAIDSLASGTKSMKYTKSTQSSSSFIKKSDGGGINSISDRSHLAKCTDDKCIELCFMRFKFGSTFGDGFEPEGYTPPRRNGPVIVEESSTSSSFNNLASYLKHQSKRSDVSANMLRMEHHVTSHIGHRQVS
jgi:hypothetical protein